MADNDALLHPLVSSALQTAGLPFEAIECDPNLADTAAFLEHYGFTADETCNAIIGIGKSDPPKYACCVVLANSKVDVNKKLSELLQIKRCSFANAEITLSITSMEIGGVTPIGLPEGIPVYLDSQIMTREKVLLGGGNRTSKVLIAPNDLVKLPNFHVIEGLGIPR